MSHNIIAFAHKVRFVCLPPAEDIERAAISAAEIDRQITLLLIWAQKSEACQEKKVLLAFYIK